MKRKEFWQKFFARGYLYAVLAVMYLPILILLIFSFTDSETFGKWTGFSLKPYADIFTNRTLLTALSNTLIIAVVSSVIATLLGTLAAIGIFYMKKTPKRIVSGMNQLPIVNAEIVTAVSLMLFFATVPFIRPGYFTLIIGHVSFCTPYVVLSVMPRLYQMDNNVYEAALDLGATPTQAFIKVLLPILLPGAIAGFILSFTISLDDFVITMFNKGTVDTLSTYIWGDATKKGIKPSTKAVATFVFILILGILLFVNSRAERQQKKLKARVERLTEPNK